MIDFCHLHNHTQYSLLDGASDIGKLMEKAKNDGQQAVALTDHGNMFGAFKFVKEAKKNGVKPIVGCEFYMVKNRHKLSFEKSKGESDERFHQLLLAKNEVGYRNLSKLCSLGHIEGMYGKYPRIDKEILVQYHEGLIATSCCIGAEIPQAILRGNVEEAENLLKWWHDLFGEDFYIEIQRQHGMQDIDGTGTSQEDVNQVLMSFAKKYNVKVIATNDSHYLNEEDAEPHDVLLCINTGARKNDEKRFKFPSNDFYFKTKEQMNHVFRDVPFALDNTMEIVSKVENLSLARDILLPAFPLPKEFTMQEDYLRHLTFVGAKKKYGTITPAIEERLNFELDVINKSGYPGYFLIVQDFTSTARDLGVSVGPGRGSAAGSAVAYCLGITNIDPIAYDLLFERFLNPERVSMPDIDIDFDDDGREKVINYVIDKYGQNQVAQIVTYGTMAARMSLRDVGRVLDVPLDVVDRVSKSFPSHLSATLDAVLAEGDISPKLKDSLDSEDRDRAYTFRELAAEDGEVGNMIRTAKQLEGSVRNTGIHACGVIITPYDITEVIPVTTAKDSSLLVSQFDNSVAEEAGLLKMDFLGLKTLSIIKDAVANVKHTTGIELDIDAIDLTDAKTYELFQKGETVGIFQYESVGMQKYLKDLKPNQFEDLIAMNALFRPGPLAYIPNFINRKHGREDIVYDLPEMEEYLKSTYGITVYQEQVMLLSQKLANFTKGEADMLRKAMGKKNRKIIDEMFPKFLEGCLKNNHPEDVVKKIWTDWEAFASYAFNKSHSTCYAYIAFQTAYLKAHYPAEFMASVLSHNKNDISKINFFLREGKRMELDILGPDVNESQLNFSVNKKGQIRFGLSALKGVGEGPVEAILTERAENGPFESVVDMMKRLNLRAVNKKCLDSMVMGGALDTFSEIHRAQYFASSGGYDTFIEHLLRFGQLYQSQKDNAQATLFGEMDVMQITTPEAPKSDEWPLIVMLDKEKEVTGIYLSGHPLDDYQLELNYFVTHSLNEADLTTDVPMKLAGIVTEVMHGVNQKGNGYAKVQLQDYNGSLEIFLSNENYQNYKYLAEKGKVLFIDCVYQKGYNSDRKFLRINNIELLETVGEKLTKSITVKIPIEEVNENLLELFERISQEYKGNHTMKLKIVTFNNQDYIMDMVVGSYKVNADFRLAKLLSDFNLAYKLN
ncbi:MAG: DNA polymerase III subunit alpha [Saprospiraceae bacterium]|nr:DNA polymerase III subunit alpha [Saprospiraceae bacterium]